MVMKKFINDPANLTDELLEGLALANADLIELQPNHLVVNKKLGNHAAPALPAKECWTLPLLVISLPLPALSPVLRHYRRHSAEKVFCTSS